MYFKLMRGILFSYALADHLIQVSEHDVPFATPEDVAKWKSTMNGYKIVENGVTILSL